MRDFVFVANYDGTILFMNGEGDTFFDYIGTNKILHTNLFELFTEKSKSVIQENIRLAENLKLQSIEPIMVEMNLSKTCYTAILELKLFYSNTGGLTIIAGNISHLDVKKGPRRYYKQLYLGFIDNLPLGVYRTGANGTIHFMNEGFVDILGYDSDEELYKINIQELFVKKELRTEMISHWTENKMYSMELQVYTRDKRIIWVKDSGHAVKDEDGNILFLDGVLEDITKQKQNELKLKDSESKLKELNASKDKFFSIISHDLRSPFNQFIGATELLLTKLEEYDKVMIRKFLTLLNEEAVQSYRLLQNLLQWSKNQRGLIQFDPKPVNLSGLVSDLLQIYEPMAWNKKIELEIEIHRDLYVYADKEMLSTILRNLISNAIKFTSEEGTITISAKEKMDEEDMFSEYLEVSVIDTGIGIPAESIPKLFNINEAVSAKGTYNESGTGLGLVLCKDFVERHNGSIWAESTYGQGSTFRFTIR